MDKQLPAGMPRFWRDPAIAGVELRLSSYDRRTFPKHSHDNYAIGLVETGESTFFFRGGSHRIGAGQLALIPPGEVHCCNPAGDSNWRYRMWHIAPGLMHGIAEEVAGTGARPCFRSPIADDHIVWGHLLHFSSLLQNSSGNAGDREEAMYASLSALLIRLGECRPRTDTARQPAAVRLAEEYLRTNIEETVTLETLANLTGLSPWHFLRLFKAAKGLPPHAFQTQLRINLARQLLREGDEIADVAYRTGFSDQCHFSRKFRQFTGATPGQYRAAQGF
ncbi:MAG: AraC family transcriptional regulator [Desulfoprunum sp.]|uniref:AraC family transcriptional regulator n=1 Tax=Desulfoprunum sp. TaxID=2020866 RepID=UPI003C72D7F3